MRRGRSTWATLASKCRERSRRGLRSASLWGSAHLEGRGAGHTMAPVFLPQTRNVCVAFASHTPTYYGDGAEGSEGP